MEKTKIKVRTPLFPTYSIARHLLSILTGVRKSSVTSMINSIRDQTGTPQNPVDWSDPDTWIEERLTGEDAELARRIWGESNHEANPRYSYGSYLFINTYSLLLTDHEGKYNIAEKGTAFLKNDPRTVAGLDEAEGLIELLSILSTKTNAKRADLLTDWRSYLKKYSKYGTDSTFKDTLRRRLRNLEERNLVIRKGNLYSITQEGIEYATEHTPVDDDPKRHVMKAIKEFTEKQQEKLRKKLGSLVPKRFEELVADLLDAMGYQDVTVTKVSGDKGVDVVGSVQFGITTVTEVVQVKRHQGSINRPVLDQLRGALPYHKAIRGTLINLGDFTQGCREAAIYPGAAPITLINGDKLIELLFEHRIGIKEIPVPLYEMDEDYFSTVLEQDEQVEEDLKEP